MEQIDGGKVRPGLQAVTGMRNLDARCKEGATGRMDHVALMFLCRADDLWFLKGGPAPLGE